MGTDSDTRLGGEATPGPWLAEPADMFGDHNIVLLDSSEDCRAVAAVVSNMRDPGEVAANARLIAAAPDHALICWAICNAGARWEAWGDEGDGEFCCGGIRHATKLDSFGVPTMTGNLRAALTKARGQSPLPLDPSLSNKNVGG